MQTVTLVSVPSFVNLLAFFALVLMAGEFCGRGCGWCGRCDAGEPEDVCPFCETVGCDGACYPHDAEVGAWLEAEAASEEDRGDEPTAA